MEAAADTNAENPTQPWVVWEQYPKLFQYLADGAPENTEMVLTAWEMDTGRLDLKDTIDRREVTFIARLEQERGHTDLDPALEAYILAGEPEEEPVHEAKPVPRLGVPVLYFEKGLLETVMERADYGESDLLDKHHTLFLKDLTDQEVYNHVSWLEQVTELVRRKAIRHLPEPVWEMLWGFEFGEGEEAVRMLREYLELANG